MDGLHRYKTFGVKLIATLLVPACSGQEGTVTDGAVCMDHDGDGYGDPGSPACTNPEPDCDDSDLAINPRAGEMHFGDPICRDGVDNDCDGSVDDLDAGCRIDVLRAIEAAGTKFLHKDKFARGKGLFHAIEYVPPDELPDEEYPMVMTTGRMFAHFHTGSMTRRSAHLNREVEESYGEISPTDAEALAVREDDKIRVTSHRGSIEIAAKWSDRIAEGTLFIPFHFVEGAANALTNVALDPVAKIPEYKVCAVRVEKAGGSR